ncbi:hypothetical protein D3C78_1069360 [compost metagenome]
MQRRPSRGLQQQLCAITSRPALHGGRHRAEQFDPAQVLSGQQALGLAAGLVKEAFGLPRLVCFGAQQRQVGKGRQSGGAAFAQGLFGKGEVTLFGQLHQQWMVCQVGLDDHFARLFGATGTTGDLHDQLGHALAGAEVTREQPTIGIEDRHQGHPGEVMPFGEHLRAHQNAWLTFLDGREQLVHRVFARRAVAVDPQHRVVREQYPQAFFGALGAGAHRPQIDRAAFRAIARSPFYIAAVVAA